jgi:hypothetical protein
MLRLTEGQPHTVPRRVPEAAGFRLSATFLNLGEAADGTNSHLYRVG